MWAWEINWIYLNHCSLSLRVKMHFSVRQTYLDDVFVCVTKTRIIYSGIYAKCHFDSVPILCFVVIIHKVYA